MIDILQEAIAFSSLIWVGLSWLKILIKPRHKVYKYLCSKCIVFWITLAITMNPFTAATAALIAALIDKHFSNTNVTL